MQQWFYATALLVSLAGLLTLDWRHKLAFFASARKAAIAVFVPVLFFLGWDAAGVGLGIFFRGETAWMTGLQLAPEIPVEEVLFLTVLCLTTLEVFVAVSRWSLRRSARSARSARSSRR